MFRFVFVDFLHQIDLRFRTKTAPQRVELKSWYNSWLQWNYRWKWNNKKKSLSGCDWQMQISMQFSSTHIRINRENLICRARGKNCLIDFYYKITFNSGAFYQKFDLRIIFTKAKFFLLISFLSFVFDSPNFLFPIFLSRIFILN